MNEKLLDSHNIKISGLINSECFKQIVLYQSDSGGKYI